MTRKNILRGTSFFDFEKQAWSLKTDVSRNCVNHFQLCFDRALHNGSGSVDDSHLNSLQKM
jgi:hypothetical protein